MPVQDFKTKYDLKEGFQWLMEHESVIRERLENFIPAYKEKIFYAREKILEL